MLSAFGVDHGVSKSLASGAARAWRTSKPAAKRRLKNARAEEKASSQARAERNGRVIANTVRNPLTTAGIAGGAGGYAMGRKKQ